MPHQVARPLRLLLLTTGVLLIACLPLSFYVGGFIRVNARTVSAEHGCLSITYGCQREREQEQFPLLSHGAGTQPSPPAPPAPDPIPPAAMYDLDSGIYLNKRIYPWDVLRSNVLLPSFNRMKGYQLSLPLWIPAVICLAWPTTSFIARRRGTRRGFLVVLRNAR